MVSGGDREAGRELMVVMPVYNEAATIGRVVRAWTEQLERLQIDHVLSVYDDGSTDGTAEVLAQLSGRLCRLAVTTHANRGHGPTILRGYREARAEWVFQVDSDDEMGPEDFEALWLRRRDYDLLLGCRTGRQSSPARRIVSWGAAVATRIVSGGDLSDVNSPYRLIRGSCLIQLLGRIPEKAFAPNVILSVLALRAGLRIHQAGIPHRARTAGAGSLLGWKLCRAVLLSVRDLAIVAVRASTRAPARADQTER